MINPISILNPPLPFIGYVGGKSPILLFTLESMGIARNGFSQRFSESFHHLDWDEYDVRKQQIELLIKFGVPINIKQIIVQQFYLGDVSLLEKLCTSYISLTNEQIKQVYSIKPCRRRAVGECRLTYHATKGWQVEVLPITPFEQPLDADDFLSYPRQFSPIARWILDDDIFQRMLRGVASTVEKVAVPAKSMKVVVHQVMSVATEKYHGDNAPEGLHQDGADYIVSALLVDRKNVEGGVSRITNEKNESNFLVHQLEIGEGLFQSDKGSELWHDVSKVYKKEQTDSYTEYGYRSTFGLDIHLES